MCNVCNVQSGVEVKNRKKRAGELLGIIGGLGPAIIKAGQALSSRPDLLPKEYLDELQKLQVRAPSMLTSMLPSMLTRVSSVAIPIDLQAFQGMMIHAKKKEKMLLLEAVHRDEGPFWRPVSRGGDTSGAHRHVPLTTSHPPVWDSAPCVVTAGPRAGV